ncbi:MAG: hypothetical protein ACEPOV_06085 [Hyphomicrobiales bacterium]
MILSFLRRSNILQQSILTIGLIILWIPIFRDSVPVSYNGYENPLYSIVVYLFQDYPVISNVLSFIFIIILGNLINSLCRSLDFISNLTMMPLVLYTIGASFSIHNGSMLTPGLFASLFIILALRIILYDQFNSVSYQSVLNSSLLIGLASLFYFPSIILLLFVYLSLYNMRSFDVKSLFIGILGIALVYVYLFSFYFIRGDLNFYLYEYLNTIGSWFAIEYFESVFIKTSIYLFFILATTLFSFFYFNKRFAEGNQQQKGRVRVIRTLFFISLLLLFVSMTGINTVVLILIPFSITLSIVLPSNKIHPLYEGIFIIWLLSILFNNYTF